MLVRCVASMSLTRCMQRCALLLVACCAHSCRPKLISGDAGKKLQKAMLDFVFPGDMPGAWTAECFLEVIHKALPEAAESKELQLAVQYCKNCLGNVRSWFISIRNNFFCGRHADHRHRRPADVL